ncbi:MAG: glycosyltransferase [Planctomycetota bacterium]|nr:glycosyltransferase [Planctomycetota bacterium]
MKVLLVSHDFLTAHPAGTEIYTYQVGIALQERGHEVHVFTTEKDIARKNLSVEVRDYEGLPVHELFNNLYYNDFEETWDYPAAARSFGVLLDDLRPDVVHFMHLLYLSVACVEEVKRRGIPVLYTLHDYWLQCARFGQRRFIDGSICHEIDFDRCGTCLADFKFRQTRVERAAGKAIAAVRSTTGLDLGGMARGLQRGLQRRVQRGSHHIAGTSDASSDQSAAAAMAAEVAKRDKALRERILPAVDRFIAPSNFLRERFLEWGIPEDQIHHMRTGISLRGFQDFQRKPGNGKRIGFIGTLAPHKGAHVLLKAWGALDAESKADASLRIWGPPAHNPTYVARLEELALEVGASVEGELLRAEVSDALAELDLLVVPSIWYENSPLIILEALATRTPLAVSDLGGMAELVEPGATGFHFKMGDDADLAVLLQRVLGDASELTRLYGEDVEVREAADDAEALEETYREFVRRRVQAETEA